MKLERGENIWRRLYVPAFMAGVSLFYLLTLAPTILWGDDAVFQRIAWESRTGPVGIDHWLWLQSARLFTYLPLGNVAYRVNLLSAVAGVLTLFFLYLAAHRLLKNRFAAAAAVLSFAVSHTFWTSAVRAEVYTIFTAFMAYLLFLWFSWREDKPNSIFEACFLFGLGMLSHQMMILMLPAFGLLLWQRRRWLSGRQWVLLLLAFLVGLLPFLIVIQENGGDRSLFDSLQAHFTRGGQFSEALFDFSPGTLVRDAALWVGFLGLQFVGIAGLLAVPAFLELGRRRFAGPWLALLALYGTAVLFAFSYHVNDQFVFYLPSYLVFALFVGKGWLVVEEKAAELRPWERLRPFANRLVILFLILFVPVVTYNLAPRLLDAAEMNPMGIRTLPGREPNQFFIWPAKNGYTGAADYAHAALQSLPMDAVLIGDHTPIQPIWYLQVVEGMRPDVRLIAVEAGQDLGPIVARLEADKPVFLADNNSSYYNLRSITGARLEPVGPIYKLLMD
jgi:hypothetical protein